jgi:hypothetical protein
MLRDVRIKAHHARAAAVPGILHDLSLTGVGISTSLRLDCGDRFALLVSMSDERSICRECRVIHVYPVTDGWWAIGAEFLADGIPEMLLPSDCA